MNLPDWRRRDAELDDEIAAHFRMAVAERMERGQTHEAATRAARLEFGNVVRLKEDVRNTWGCRAVEGLVRDCRYACRSLSRSPGFFAAAIVTMALGLGAVMLVFTAINGVFLKALAIQDPDRVVGVGRQLGTETVPGGHSYPDYRDLQHRNTTFVDLAAFFQLSMTLNVPTGISRETPHIVSGNYFDVLGIRPALGRLLEPGDDRDDAAPTIVLSYDFWRTAFRANPAIVGTVVRVAAGRASAAGGISGERLHTVVGVAPEGFYGTDSSVRPSAWIPLHSAIPEPELARRRGLGPYLTVFGRLKDGVSEAAGQSNLAAIVGNLAGEYPVTNAQYQVRITDLRSRVDIPATRAFAMAILVLSALVLLTACATLATGLVARTLDRQRELGIRVALGAGRVGVVRLVLVEALIICALGSVAALAAVSWATRLLSTFSVVVGNLAAQVDVRPDGRVFLTAMAFAVLALGLATAAPARLIAVVDVNSALRREAFGWSRRWGTRDVLTLAQVAFSCLLLVACVVSVLGMWRASTTPLGFDAEQLATVTLDFDVATYTREQQLALMERAAVEVRRLPGVEQVAYMNDLPLSGVQSVGWPVPEGRSFDRTVPPAVRYVVDGDFFTTLGIPLLEGRLLSVQDAGKAVVNSAFVRQVLGTGRAVGAHVTIANAAGVAQVPANVEVVGVVADSKHAVVWEGSRGAIYTPMRDIAFGRPTMVVRTSGDPSATAAAAHRVIAAIDPTLPMRNVGSAEELMRPAFLPGRAAAATLTAFAIVAMLLATAAIQGAVRSTVSRRRKEIGIRVALGASRARIAASVVGRTAVIAIAGTAAGMLAALGLARVLAHVVYLASADEPVVMIAVIVLMCLLLCIAVVGPVVGSLRGAPMAALRLE